MKQVAALTVVLASLTACKQKAAVLPGVPLPASTPYDHNADAREYYLQYYAEGYRQGLTGTRSTCCLIECSYRKARIDGWYDGQLAGASVWAQTLMPEDTAEPSDGSGRGGAE